MTSNDNIAFLRERGRRYISGTPKSMLKQFERELLSPDWKEVREGLQVQLCPSAEGSEVFILCRSVERVEKERAIDARFEQRIEVGLRKIAPSTAKRKQKAGQVERRVGQLLGRNPRAAGLFETRVADRGDGYVVFTWLKKEACRQRSRLSEGFYLLRSNATDWTREEL